MADKKQIKPVWWWILGVVLFCVLCWLIWCPSGLERKDAITSCIALSGVVAVVVGIFQTQRRITKQEKQFREQTELQQKQQRDARFASGVELLGNPHESTRIGGAYNLYFLARDYPEYITPVCEILCAHLRTIASKRKFQTEEDREKYPHNEIQTIINLLFRKFEKTDSIFVNEMKDINSIFLRSINFSGTRDIELVVDNVYFDYTELLLVHFHGVKFGRAVSFRKSEIDHPEVTFAGSSLANSDYNELVNPKYTITLNLK